MKNLTVYASVFQSIHSLSFQAKTEASTNRPNVRGKQEMYQVAVIPTLNYPKFP